MRRVSGVFAFAAGAALIVTTAGAAVAQDDGQAAEAAEPSTLSIHQVANDYFAREPLAGKAYDKAVTKAAPNAIRYFAEDLGADDVERVIELSLMARAMEEAGEFAAAQALIDLATLIYRSSWTAAKSDPAALNDQIEAFIAAGEYAAGDPALVLSSDGTMGRPGFYDLCLKRDNSWSYADPETPSACANGGGRPVRASDAPQWIHEYGVGSPPLTERLASGEGVDSLHWGVSLDLGGLGIHKVVQHKTADDKLAGKQYKKALAKALKKQGPAIAKALAGGSGGGLERGVIELVLLARAADEAGNTKAAKAFMDLALTAYRATVREYEMTAIPMANIARLVESDYAGIPGLQIVVPPDMTDACFDSSGTCIWPGVDGQMPWLCEVNGLTVDRMTHAEAEAAGCPMG